MKRVCVLGVVCAVLLALVYTAAAAPWEGAESNVYERVNLVSDIDGVARFTDSNLVNPWGLGFSSTSPFWIADNNAGVSTLYNGHGQAFPVGNPLVVTIPKPDKTPGGAPTGLVFNGTGDFVVSSGPKSGPGRFLFSTEDGTILGWNPAVDPTNAVIAVDNSKTGAVYKGLAIGSSTRGNLIFAANFHDGVVEIYDKNFKLAGTFTDPNVDANFAPFGIQNIDGKLYVTFAKQKLPDKHDDQSGDGNGYVDVFDTDGNFVRRFATKGTLNSPWGLALAPEEFGMFSRHLLVGNFGNGRINAFDVASGEFEAQLIDPEHNPLAINGLWALQFGNGAPNGGSRHKLFFTAGIGDESHGLFGYIKAKEGDENDE